MKSLLDRWKNRKKSKTNKEKKIALPKEMSVPLSFGQERLWFLQQLHPKNAFYNFVYIFDFKGKLDSKRLLKSFDILAERHQILRTTFQIKQGKAVQVVNPKPQFEVQTFDISNLSSSEQTEEFKNITKTIAEKSFDLEQGPLIDIGIIKRNDEQTTLIVNLHHIVTDKWSMTIFGEELGIIYQNLGKNRIGKLPILTAQYADFAHWQTTKKVNEHSLNYWKKKLAGDLPILNLPTDYLRPSIPTYRGGHLQQTFSTDLSKKLIHLAKEANTTLFVLLLTAYKVLLHRYSKQEDIIVGTPIINRDKVAFEKLIGFFTDTVALRSDLSKNLTFLDLLQQVRTTTLEAFSNKNIPFETIVKALKTERYVGINPVFQAMFLYNETTDTPSFGKDLEVKEELLNTEFSKFDLTLFTTNKNGQLSTTFEYSTDLFEKTTIEKMQTHFGILLQSIIDNPEERINKLSLLGKKERQLILENWNQSAIKLSNIPTVLQVIEKQANLHPNQTAVVFEYQKLTYQELNNKAKIIAAYLQQMGVRKGSLVGLYMERSVDMIIGVLAILKAGAAYLPLDPEYPMERINFMVEDANVPIILTQDHLIDNFPNSGATILGVKRILKQRKQEIQKNEITSDDIAYVIYTSGSTGKPKGVQVSHKNLAYSTMVRFEYYSKSPNTFLLLSSFAFDSSIVGIFWTLCNGGKLVIPKHRIEQDLEALGGLINQHQVTHTLLVPSLYGVLLQHLTSEQLKSLNTVIVAGEACSPLLCKQHFSKLSEQVKLYNEYGPTEASVWCTVHELTPSDAKGLIPIGRPIPNTQIYILDQNLEPVPTGISGELYVGGDGITKGYLNRPELNKERFIINPFDATSKTKLYKTGDLARFRSDGIIDFLGRVDHQVKIRGYRIELEEIREVVKKYEGVEEAIVVIHQEVREIEETTSLVEMLGDLEANEVEQLLNSVKGLPDAKINLMLEAMNK